MKDGLADINVRIEAKDRVTVRYHVGVVPDWDWYETEEKIVARDQRTAVEI